ncbi:hypothetical protein LP419_38605 [Massilia sp. H-1]|nr:hypothetical protein LP419_38605 [Massilia sp. H-1]
MLEVYGRKISDGLRKGTPLHLYLPGPHRGVWNGAVLAASNEIILCESLIDAMTFWCAWLPQRDGQLRRGGLYGRAPGRVPGTRHEPRADRLRPRRGRQSAPPTGWPRA